MDTLFLPTGLAQTLKARGFDYPCIAITNSGSLKGSIFYGKFNPTHEYYNEGLILYQQAVDFFREKYGIGILSDSYRKNGEIHYSWNCYNIKENKTCYSGALKYADKDYPKFNYYEALTEAIEEALKLI